MKLNQDNFNILLINKNSANQRSLAKELGISLGKLIIVSKL